MASSSSTVSPAGRTTRPPALTLTALADTMAAIASQSVSASDPYTHAAVAVVTELYRRPG